jgi:hypothetical protein
MDPEGYYQPKSCEINQRYYLRVVKNGSEVNFQRVRFIGYCPHPAEILIHDGKRIKVVHRTFLYLKESRSGERI